MNTDGKTLARFPHRSSNVRFLRGDEMYNNGYNNRPMSVGDWFVTLLILAIPIVNIIMYIVWAVSSTGNVNRRNFCRASILWVPGSSRAELSFHFVSANAVA